MGRLDPKEKERTRGESTVTVDNGARETTVVLSDSKGREGKKGSDSESRTHVDGDERSGVKDWAEAVRQRWTCQLQIVDDKVVHQPSTAIAAVKVDWDSTKNSRRREGES